MSYRKSREVARGFFKNVLAHRGLVASHPVAPANNFKRGQSWLTPLKAWEQHLKPED